MPLALRAQVNLVPNPSFEEVTHCPISREDIENLVGWYSPTWGSPDIHHVCINTPSSTEVPQNDFGWQWPRTGQAYCGFHQSDFVGSEGREYLQCELLETLESGQMYLVEFFVSRADSSTKANDNIGAFFSGHAIDGIDVFPLPYEPQIVSPNSQPITDDFGWVRIADTLIGTGMEKYLTIGVFTNNAATNWVEVQGGWEEEAHYYIDDVSVIALESATCSFNDIRVPNVFTPNRDSVNDSFRITKCDSISGVLYIYDRWGNRVFSTSGTDLSWDGRVNGINSKAGVYYYFFDLTFLNKQHIVKKGYVHLLR